MVRDDVSDPPWSSARLRNASSRSMCINSDCRFYQRIVMVFIIFYSISLNAPFIQGILAFLVCIIILIMDSMCVDFARARFSLCDCRPLHSLLHSLLLFLTSALLQVPAVPKQGFAAARHGLLVPAGIDERCAAAIPVPHIICAPNQLQPATARCAAWRLLTMLTHLTLPLQTKLLGAVRQACRWMY